MTDQDSQKRGSKSEAVDVTGRDRLLRNLTGRYLGQIVVIVSGFIIPRLISDTLGTVALGLWDFGWSVVSYFRYMGLGLAAGLNRYVALYNARRDYENLQRAVSSTSFLQAILAAVIAAVSVGISALMPQIFADIPPQQIEQSRLVVLFLGCSLAVKTVFWPSRAILTGYHLVTVTAAVTAAGDIAMLVGMFMVLRTGGGLAELGMIVLGATLAVETLRLVMAKRVYRYPILNWSAVNGSTMKEMLVFGLKNTLSAVPGILVLQTSAVFLAASAGPAALAVYARPLALFMHVDRLIHFYAALLTPVASSLQGLDREEELKEFLLSSLQASFAMTIPAVLLLAGYGDVIVKVWMGQDYVIPSLAPILGAAVLIPYGNSAAMRILVGVNSHGKASLKSLIVTVITLAIACTIAFSHGWSAEVAAMVTGVSLLAGPGVVVVVEACRRFQVSFSEYLTGVLLKPLMCNAVLLGVILASRMLNDNMNLPEAAMWGAMGGLGVVALYWKFLLTDELRTDLRGKFGRRKPAASRSID